MVSSVDYLKAIYGTLLEITKSTINSKTSDTSNKAQSNAVKGLGLSGLGDISASKTKNIKELGPALIDLAKGIKELSGGLFKLWITPGKSSLSKFIKSLSNPMTVAAASFLPIVSQAILKLSECLPKLAMGILKFGLAAKVGLVSATAKGINQLMFVLIELAASAPVIWIGIAVMIGIGTALAGLGMALDGLANLVKSFALLVLGFTASIIILVGAIWLASKLFGVGPLEAMGMIGLSIIILAGSIALLGLLSPLIILGGAAASSMGMGLLLIGLGLIAFGGAIALINMMGVTTSDFIQMALVVGILGLMTSVLGLLSILIIPGAIASQMMGKGLILLSIGILAFGVVSWLLNTLTGGTGIFPMVWDVVKSMGILALLMVGLGIAMPFILPGLMLFGLMILGLIFVAITIKTFNALTNKIDFKQVQLNVKDAISGLLIGTYEGLNEGLGGGKGQGNFFTKLGRYALLMTGIGLIFHLAFTLCLFAKALQAFNQAGSIKMITGYRKDGSPIFGSVVNVTATANIIADTLSTFMNTLYNSFSDPTRMPSTRTINKVGEILLGSSAYSLLGIKFGKDKKGIIEPLMAFTKLLETWAKYGKKGEIIYYNGKTQKSVSIRYIIGVMTSTISLFIKSLAANFRDLEKKSIKDIQNVAEILMGSETSASLFGGLGFSFHSKKIGILTPLMTFTDILTKYASGTVVDKNGKKHAFNPEETAQHIVNNMTTFIKVLNEGLAKAKIEEPSGEVKKKLENFGKFTEHLDVLIDKKDGMQLIAQSMDTLARSIGMLLIELGKLTDADLEKINKLAQQATDVHFPSGGNNFPGPSIPPGPGNTGSSGSVHIDYKKVTDSINSALANKNFEFNFTNNSGGVIVLGKRGK